MHPHLATVVQEGGQREQCDVLMKNAQVKPLQQKKFFKIDPELATQRLTAILERQTVELESGTYIGQTMAGMLHGMGESSDRPNAPYMLSSASSSSNASVVHTRPTDERRTTVTIGARFWV